MSKLHILTCIQVTMVTKDIKGVHEHVESCVFCSDSLVQLLMTCDYYLAFKYLFETLKTS